MKRNRKNLWNSAGWIVFCLYIVMLSYFLFFSERYGRNCITEEYRYNLVLFKEINRFIQYRHILGVENVVVNIFGNILAFAPFGFLLPLLRVQYRKFWYVGFLSLLFSLSIETIQMLLKVGIFDVDDLFMNTLGGIMGYIAYAIGSRIYIRYRARSRKSKD